MKLMFNDGSASGSVGPLRQACRASGESRPLRHVLLADPAGMEAVPCCSATQTSLKAGFVLDAAMARKQHATLQAVLEQGGVGCTVVMGWTPPDGIDVPEWRC